MFTGVAKKQIIPGGGFTNASANGNAIFNVTGADADVAGGANVTIGQITADGQGNLSGILTSGGGGNGVIWIVSANRFVLLLSTNTGDKKPSATIFHRQ